MGTRLRPGVSVDDAIQVLETLSINAYGNAMPTGESHPAPAREEYVRWATSAERQLAAVLGRVEAGALFENPRHRDICSMPPDQQLRILIGAEVANKTAELQELADELKAERERLNRGSGQPAILDTNVLLQCLRPDQVKWASVVGEPARLILPLRVIEELDEKKYAKDGNRRDTARDVLIWLERLRRR